MRILFLSAWYPHPPDNGSKARAHHLLKALTERHEVDLVTFLPPEGTVPKYDLIAEGLCARAHLVHRAPFEAHPWQRRRGLFSRTPSHLKAYRSIEMEHLAASLAADRNLDVVIASTGLVAPLAVELPARGRILEEHNFLGRMLREQHESAADPVRRCRTWLAWRKDIAFERRLFRRFDLVTMVSAQDAAAVHAAGCATTRIEVVPNGVTLAEAAAPAAQPVAGRMVYAGSVTYDANLEAVRWFAAEILPRVRQEVPEACLTVTGSTAGVDLSGLIDQPGIDFTGYVEDVRALVASSRVAVLPLLTGGGTRLKALEAMAVGVPVVSTSKGVEGLNVQSGIHCMVADSPARFAEHTVHLLRHPEAADPLVAAASALVTERYDWRSIGSRFVDLVEAVAT